MDSILTSIKKLLGITEEYTQFDIDITMYINTIISVLTQIGVGSNIGFIVNDATDTWDDWLPTSSDLESVKTYIYLRVRLLFDPPTNSAVTKSYEQIIRELECRLLIATDPPLLTEVLKP